ncbi:MAG: CarD family transcriptional regulator [Bdellovibrionota bacterium]|tara:strand:+ start:4360 stop:4884 length:525 start_codon:yes stop_codon:yes gene_type:complete
MFGIGDLAVYPGYGVGKIVDIETKEICGSMTEFLAIELIENGSKLFVPKAAAKSKGLRPIIGEDEVENILTVLQTERTAKEKKLDTQTWNRRHREYMEKIKTGSVIEIAQVMRDLYILQGEKELSSGEKNMLDQAKGLLVREVSIATNTDESEVEEEIRSVFISPSAEMPEAQI